MPLTIEFQQKTFQNTYREPKEFEEIALELRRDVIKSLYLAKSGHSGGSLGIADIMSVLFFGGIMRYDSQNWKWEKRDRFVLSAGHLAPILYSTLARAGFFPVEELKTLRKIGSRLQGHPGRDMELPGIESSTGSLGQGVSIAVGMALSHRYLDKTDQRVFTLSGDGELEEGSTWEAAMAAGNYKLNNLCWIVDNNNCQIDGRVEDVMSVYPLVDKFKAFNFDVIEIDGHSYTQLLEAFNCFIRNSSENFGKPVCIIAHTFMGKGVSFMEDNYKWHGNPPNEEQAIQALKELDKYEQIIKSSNMEPKMEKQ
ncbi:MAG TPA: transketolase [Bacteroidota bacterium]|nr:transketolase [Bacteroidota bacterium]